MWRGVMLPEQAERKKILLCSTALWSRRHSLVSPPLLLQKANALIKVIITL